MYLNFCWFCNKLGIILPFYACLLNRKFFWIQMQHWNRAFMHTPNGMHRFSFIALWHKPIHLHSEVNSTYSQISVRRITLPVLRKNVFIEKNNLKRVEATWKAWNTILKETWQNQMKACIRFFLVLLIKAAQMMWKLFFFNILFPTPLKEDFKTGSCSHIIWEIHDSI